MTRELSPAEKRISFYAEELAKLSRGMVDDTQKFDLFTMFYTSIKALGVLTKLIAELHRKNA